MQRAFNSKRSIAEIALTRMCEAKTAVTAEALALRVDELEKELQMLRVTGVSVGSSHTESVTVMSPEEIVVQVGESEPTVAVGEMPSAADQTEPELQRKTELLSSWRSVIERITELKPSLAGQLSTSDAYRRPDGSFLIRMSGVFAGRLATDERSMGIVRTCLSDELAIPVDDIKLIIVPLETYMSGDYSREIEEAIKNANN